MPTLTLPQIEPRRVGERCCDTDAVPNMTMAQAERAAADLEVVAHPIRLQLLDLLARKEGRVCVCDLENAVSVKQPTVSHHLRILRKAGLVDSERQGLYAYYFVNRSALEALRTRIGDRLAALR